MTATWSGVLGPWTEMAQDAPCLLVFCSTTMTVRRFCRGSPPASSCPSLVLFLAFLLALTWAPCQSITLPYINLCLKSFGGGLQQDLHSCFSCHPRPLRVSLGPWASAPCQSITLLLGPLSIHHTATAETLGQASQGLARLHKALRSFTSPCKTL
jgi:hypothetical protein